MSGVGGSQTYKLEIIVEGQDKASGPLNGVGGALGSIGTIAAGIISSQVFMAIAREIGQMGSAAISATANYQSMQVGIEALLAREISRGQTEQRLIEHTTSLTAAEQLRMIELGRSYDTLSTQVENTKTKWEAASAAQGAGSEVALKLQVELQGLQGDLKTTSYEFETLKSRASGAVLVMESFTTGTMTVAEALPQARLEAEKLLKQIRLLAIQSPFQLEDVQTTFKMAMAFGFASEEAMAFTRGILNTAAGVGANNDMLNRMAYNLAQIRLVGKVTAMDVRQLAMAGFDLNGALIAIAKQFGYTITSYGEFNDLIASGKLDWADFASSFEKYADTQFGGASKRLSQTWNGMMSNFKDVFGLTMPAILGPAMEKVTGFMNGLMTQFLKFTESGKLEEAGAKISAFVQSVLDFFGRLSTIKDKIGNFSELFAQWGGGDGFVFAMKEAFDITLPPGFASVFDTATGIVEGFKTDIQTALDGFGGIKINSFGELQYRFKVFFHDLVSPEAFTESVKRAFGINVPPEVQASINVLAGLVDKVKGAFDKAKPSLDGAFANFGAFWQNEGAGIVEKLQGIWDIIQQLRFDIFQKASDILGDLAAKIIPWVAEQFEKISAWFVDNGPLIQAFLAQLQGVFQELAIGIQVALVIIGGAFQIAWAFIQPILSGLINIILDIARLIMQVATGDWAGAWNSMKQIVIDFWIAISTGFVAFWNTFLGWFGTSFADLGFKFTGWWGGVKLRVEIAWDNITFAIKEKTAAIIGDIKQWVLDIIQKIKDKIADFKQTGRDFIQGLWDGLKEKIDSMIAWLGSKMAEVVQKAKDILGIASPSKVFFDIGKNIMVGLGNGVDANAGSATDSVTDAVGGVTRASQNITHSNSNANTYTNRITLQVITSDPRTAGNSVLETLLANGMVLG